MQSLGQGGAWCKRRLDAIAIRSLEVGLKSAQALRRMRREARMRSVRPIGAGDRKNASAMVRML